MVCWVFGYGSIMFRPDFTVAEVRPALLRGRRRVFGHPSVRNWGTPERPAPTASLVDGGETWGLALRPVGGADEILDLLVGREASTPEVTRLQTAVGPVTAHVWPMGSAWSDWGLDRLVAAAVANVEGGGGPHGDAWDYVDGMRGAMREHGLVDPFVERYHRALAVALAGKADR